MQVSLGTLECEIFTISPIHVSKQAISSRKVNCILIILDATAI